MNARRTIVCQIQIGQPAAHYLCHFTQSSARNGTSWIGRVRLENVLFISTRVLNKDIKGSSFTEMAERSSLCRLLHFCITVNRLSPIKPLHPVRLSAFRSLHVRDKPSTAARLNAEFQPPERSMPHLNINEWEIFVCDVFT